MLLANMFDSTNNQTSQSSDSSSNQTFLDPLPAVPDFPFKSFDEGEISSGPGAFDHLPDGFVFDRAHIDSVLEVLRLRPKTQQTVTELLEVMNYEGGVLKLVDFLHTLLTTFVDWREFHLLTDCPIAIERCSYKPFDSATLTCTFKSFDEIGICSQYSSSGVCLP